MAKFKVELSISEFIAEMNKLQIGFEKRMMHFSLDLAIAIQKQTQENIIKTFGKGTGPRSDLTTRSYGSSARRSGRGGALMRSVIAASTARGEATVTVGGTGVPYAAIQEEGGVIRPKNSQYLTIPFQPEFQGTRAREHNLSFAMDPQWGPVLRIAGPQSLKSEAMIAYLLRRKVTIPARPYLSPAVETVTADPQVRAMMLMFLGKDRLNIEVR